MRGESVLFSSARAERDGERGSDEWETPAALIPLMEKRLGCVFDLDAAGTEANKKAPRVLTLEDDALECSWGTFKNAFCNPPYSITSKFLLKGLKEVKKCNKTFGSSQKINFFIPSRTDLSIYRDIASHIFLVTYLIGRVQFEVDGKPVQSWNKKTQKWETHSAPFPSMILTMIGRPVKQTHCEWWDWRKDLKDE